MIIFHSSNELTGYLNHCKKHSDSIGFVPTMGALHLGHLSLIQESKKYSNLTVCSIFVNPTQFNNKADFEKYPITITQDIRLLETAGCEILFLPTVSEIYPSGTENKSPYNLGFLETVLEGPYRPGHFQGVCMVMDRLLSIVQPQHLFMGLKDYQQCMVVKRLIDLKKWNESIIFHACPTLREKDGLAMSSRNMRLTAEQRFAAPIIYQTLNFIKLNIQPGNLQELKQNACEMLVQKGLKIDYVEIADAHTLKPVHFWNGQQALTALAAAFLGDVRLIDNMILTS